MKNQVLIVVGHRGAKGLAPENTLTSIQKALDAGAHEIETDVRVTKDDVPVHSHNSFLQQGTRIMKIAEYTYDELRHEFPDLATLKQSLTLINRRAVPHIEVKRREPVAPIAAVIRNALEAGTYEPSDLLIGSKDEQTLEALHATLPEIEKVVIHPWSAVIAIRRARRLGTKRISMRSWWLWSGLVHAMGRRGYMLYAYTLNNPPKARRWHAQGLYGVVTDNPDYF